MIIIIDSGLGNLGSIQNMVRKAGGQALISSEIEEIALAKKLILPGVGSFDSGMSNLIKLGLIDILNKKVIKDGIPILGICLGMQLFAKKSQEGSLQGLGWIDAEVVRFDYREVSNIYKIPHMGWNTLIYKESNILFADFMELPRFYFVHSYHLKCYTEKDIIAKTNYGYDFVSAVCHNNIFGVQFHPEKSHKYGLKLMKNFVELV
ncbi:MAG: imidazole glycerol phosphate synthase subunit HisH [Bacillota bacterium]